MRLNGEETEGETDENGKLGGKVIKGIIYGSNASPNLRKSSLLNFS